MSGNHDTARDEVAQRYLPLHIALYSLRRPGGRASASIYSTQADGGQTFVEMIRSDEILALCTTYLEDRGAPVFADGKRHDDYLDDLEALLRAGTAPTTAQQEALRRVPPR
ncbi:hypothetical protein GXW78_11730 [Roseomonas terrae]|uniref:Uncharacterized protein n=1 Tax=Neoroseomonas terrae TaxID=424799 RepID=A0ABS5EH41_9PROT|nr:hypothetical protein [Neoroseomonas terrae]MBR0650335.1 hypothetical protein [Neoroseomonas terrae]